MRRDLMHVIKVVGDGMERIANNSLKPFNITVSQAGILKFLHEQEENKASLKIMEQYFLVTQATMQGTIKRLSKKGLVSLKQDSKDKRVKHAMLTKKGMLLWKEIKKVKQENEQSILSKLSIEEQELVINLLMKIDIN